MRKHKRLYTRLFRKTYRHRPNQRREYLRTRRKRRAKYVRRALRAVGRLQGDGSLSPLRDADWEGQGAENPTTARSGSSILTL